MNVAVLIPVFRNQAGLDRSLDSMRRAEGEFEVVIVDDGSTESICAPPRLREDVPVTLIRLERNQGIAGALNHGLRHILARGRNYIARLDAGDTVVRQRFSLQSAFLDANPRCAVVSSFVEFVDANETPLFRYRAPTHHVNILRRLRMNNCVMHPGSMIRGSALRDLGLYREDVPGAEDYELFLRMAHRYTLAVLPEVLTRMEYSLTGLSIAGRWRQQRQRLKLQLSYFDPTSPFSFYGLGCTLLTMLVPHGAAFRFKRACFR